jgi:hypothetical protein
MSPTWSFPPSQVIRMDGELVPWEDAQVHVLTHGLHYGTGVLEGSRVHATRTGPAAFRLNDHLYASLPKSYRGAPVGFSAAHVVKTGTLTHKHRRSGCSAPRKSASRSCSIGSTTTGRNGKCTDRAISQFRWQMPGGGLSNP